MNNLEKSVHVIEIYENFEQVLKNEPGLGSAVQPGEETVFNKQIEQTPSIVTVLAEPLRC